MQGSRWIYGLLLVPSLVFSAPKPPQAAVATSHPLATQAGMTILDQGGNAFDAAVTIAAVLAVVEPYNSGLGGGGFWLLHNTNTTPARDIFIDGRERAPRAATADMYVQNGKLDPLLSKEGALAAAIPGEVAGMVYLSKNYGRLPLSKTLGPAIALAELGFPVDKIFADKLRVHQNVLRQFASTRETFFPQDNLLQQGMTLKQPALAKVLKTIAEKGHAGFYAGNVAKELVMGVREAGGLWQIEDLRDYQVAIRRPIQGRYQNTSIITAPLPSSGGVGLISTLNILNLYEMKPLSDADRNHLIIESLKRAGCDRMHYLGDPDFTKTKVDGLLDMATAHEWHKTMDLNHATPSKNLNCQQSQPAGMHTTHYSILDREGNAVAATLSNNSSFGSGFVVPNTGIVLNNEMNDFAIAINEPNSYEQLGSVGNLIAPTKRPLSNMTPTFISTPNGFGIMGTSGGSRIPSMMVLAILTAQQQENPSAWVKTPRFHHQYMPDTVEFEPGAFNESMRHALIQRGHQLKEEPDTFGNLQAIFWDKKTK